MREIILDTETTGLDPASGDRVVEIGLVELENLVPTGVTRQWYLNPERDMPEGAFRVHGLSAEFLADKPLFAEIADEFLMFIGEAPLIAHNADFDMKFVNAELAKVGKVPIPKSRSIDTVMMARRKFPGAQASLDALCRRFNIDNTHRTRHGALLDAELLAEVYLELKGGRQPDLVPVGETVTTTTTTVEIVTTVSGAAIRPARPHQPSAAELGAHTALLAKLKTPLWLS